MGLGMDCARQAAGRALLGKAGAAAAGAAREQAREQASCCARLHEVGAQHAQHGRVGHQPPASHQPIKLRPGGGGAMQLEVLRALGAASASGASVCGDMLPPCRRLHWCACARARSACPAPPSTPPATCPPPRPAHLPPQLCARQHFVADEVPGGDAGQPAVGRWWPHRAAAVVMGLGWGAGQLAAGRRRGGGRPRPPRQAQGLVPSFKAPLAPKVIGHLARVGAFACGAAARRGRGTERAAVAHACRELSSSDRGCAALQAGTAPSSCRPPPHPRPASTGGRQGRGCVG